MASLSLHFVWLEVWHDLPTSNEDLNAARSPIIGRKEAL